MKMLILEMCFIEKNGLAFSSMGRKFIVSVCATTADQIYTQPIHNINLNSIHVPLFLSRGSLYLLDPHHSNLCQTGSMSMTTHTSVDTISLPPSLSLFSLLVDLRTRALAPCLSSEKYYFCRETYRGREKGKMQKYVFDNMEDIIIG